MDNQHPITPPPELVKQWVTEVWHEGTPARLSLSDMHIATEAALWAADQELEACCLLLDDGEHAASYGCHNGTSIRVARRPKPPSLKEQALEALAAIEGDFNTVGDRADTIRRALEALDD